MRLAAEGDDHAPVREHVERGDLFGQDQRVALGQHQDAGDGYEAMSVAAVAEEAGTTRPALYRRWATKADLALLVPEIKAMAPEVVAELRAVRGKYRLKGVTIGELVAEGRR